MINGSISSNLEDLFHDIHGTIKIEKIKYVQPFTLYIHQNNFIENKLVAIGVA